jgi:hypothetical protein
MSKLLYFGLDICRSYGIVHDLEHYSVLFCTRLNLVVDEGFCFVLVCCNLFQQLEKGRDGGDILYVNRRGFWGMFRAWIVLTFGVVGFH